MKCLKYLFFSILINSYCFSQNHSEYWSRNNRIASDKLTAFYSLDINLFRELLNKVNDKHSNQRGALIKMPSLNNGLESFEVWENSNFDPQLQLQYPEIRSYCGIGSNGARIYFSFSHLGLQSVVCRIKNKKEYIRVLNKNTNIYGVTDDETLKHFTSKTICDVNEEEIFDTNHATKSSNNTFKTIRLAFSCTGEYTQFFGGAVADALAGMNASLTRLNSITERDLAVHFNLIPETIQLIYTNPNTDPYGNSWNWNGELQNNLNSTIGSNLYDIGHLLSTTSESAIGNAGCIGCVCNDSNKGRAYSTAIDGIPVGDNFDVRILAHEIGHQLGANHTFSFESESTLVQVEPGSGSTIMGYAGNSGYDIQVAADDMYAYRSINQIQSKLATVTCPANIAFNNSTPIVSAGNDYTIPLETPFVLTGTATDQDAQDNLTYSWEQNDRATAAYTGDNSYVSATKVYGPNFRIFPPNAAPYRYFPKLEKVINGELTNYLNWESLSTVGRILNFSLTVRDNHQVFGQTSSDLCKVTVTNQAGPFVVTSQNTNDIIWLEGSQQLITWNVASTNLPPINTSNVRILLSTDGGVTFPIVLSNSTPNDGNEIITVPQINSSQGCRIMVKAVDNIYFAVNTSPFYAQTLNNSEFENEILSYIYPNPAQTEFMIQIQDNTKLKEVNLYNNLGQLLIKSTSSKIDIRELSKSTYHVEIVTDKGSVLKNLIIN